MQGHTGHSAEESIAMLELPMSHHKQHCNQTGSSDDDDHACASTLSLRQLAAQGAASLMTPYGGQDAPMTQQYHSRPSAAAADVAASEGQVVDADMWDSWAQQDACNQNSRDEAAAAPRRVSDGQLEYSPDERCRNPSLQELQAECARIQQINDDVVQVLIVIMTSVNESCKENETMHAIMQQVKPPKPPSSSAALRQLQQQQQPQQQQQQQQQQLAAPAAAAVPPRTSVSGVCPAPLQRQHSAPMGFCAPLATPLNNSSGSCTPLHKPIRTVGGSCGNLALQAANSVSTRVTRGRLSSAPPLSVLMATVPAPSPGASTAALPSAPPVAPCLRDRSKSVGSLSGNAAHLLASMPPPPPAVVVAATAAPLATAAPSAAAAATPAVAAGSASAPASASSSPMAPPRLRSGEAPPPNTDPFWVAEHYWGSWGAQHVDMLIASCPASTTVRKAAARGPRALVRALSDVPPALPALKVQCR